MDPPCCDGLENSHRRKKKSFMFPNLGVGFVLLGDFSCDMCGLFRQFGIHCSCDIFGNGLADITPMAGWLGTWAFGCWQARRV